jgi:2-succinyl-5-enolpyruvyl-6-hydroxy-3-cyclohexene-1-carboxylate synthase
MPEQIPMNALDDIEEFILKHRPVVLIGYIPERAQKVVVDFLKRYKFPVYAEGISGLRGHPELQDNLIKSGEKSINTLIEKGVCDSILRLGGIPTARIWRDLEEKYRELPVLTVSYNHYTGLSRESMHFICMDILSQVDVVPEQKSDLEKLAFDVEKYAEVELLFKKFPLAEPSLIRELSKQLKDQSVYLGNSSPIREWDLAADPKYKPLRVVGNRGANGIDGQLSAFLGWSHSHSENWALVGDLTAMYDLSAPWIQKQMDDNIKLRIVVINNKGGQIFDRMFQKEIYLNRHELSFKNWAAMWSWDYQLWNEVPAKIDVASRQVIELVPDPAQTAMFWQSLGDCWKE